MIHANVMGHCKIMSQLLVQFELIIAVTSHKADRTQMAIFIIVGGPIYSCSSWPQSQKHPNNVVATITKTSNL